MTIAVWLGTAPPRRTMRWLDGALAAAANFPSAIAIAAGPSDWLDLAADRAIRAGVPSAGVRTELELDYLGWAQVAVAAVRVVGATTVLVDEASRPERFPEVAAIAELLDAAQLTHVVALSPDGPVIQTSRIAGRELQTIRVHGSAVIGLRIPAAPLDEHPTPMPSKAMRRLDLVALGLDPLVLGHRALPLRSTPPARTTVERVADHLSVFLAPRHAGKSRSPVASAQPYDPGRQATSLPRTPSSPRRPSTDPKPPVSRPPASSRKRPSRPRKGR